MPHRHTRLKLLALTLAVSGLAGCSSYMPYAGPRVGAVEHVGHNKTLDGIQLINVDYALAHQLKDRIEKPRLSHMRDFTNPNPQLYTVGPGDTLQVYIWEAPPAMLFATSATSIGAGAGSGSIMTAIPEQMVGSNGDITVPFAGQIPCAGKTLDEIGAEIRTRLKNMAHDPQVVVHLVSNHAQSISVVGNVRKSTQVSLIPGGVSVLQALAAAGGVAEPVNKVTIQLSYAGQVLQLPLEDIIRHPEENLSLRAGDVLTALYKPLHVNIMGATTKTKDIDFSATGISLATALSQAGGLKGDEADAKAVFVFRMENADLLPSWPSTIHPNAKGEIPVVFRFDFSNPATLFAAQEFPIQNKDIIYVASAPITDLQKFLGLIIQIVYPIQGLSTAGIVK